MFVILTARSVATARSDICKLEPLFFVLAIVASMIFSPALCLLTSSSRRILVVLANVKLTGTLRRAGFGLGFWSPNLDRRKVSG